ncbi:S-layer homology domain-containing protein [Kyrpidia spormannii]|uniref:SLH domain-containing protein n=1 Tax=Kyrpidia spormannii TaxID=2055160 RepID=A0A6F9E7T5_9BACL|nr:S-layer homology domain-containing protein [Kyrpidia spormannii]CAB3392593.1 exported protein of unknown function [Kyrpidia spormannii]
MRPKPRSWAAATAAAVLSLSLVGTARADGIPFSDIHMKWYDAQVTAAYNAGWVHGYPDGTFRGEQSVTRGQFLAFLTSGLQVDQQPGDEQLARDTFPDADRMSDVGVWRLGAAIRLGIIVPSDYQPPWGSGNFDPQTPITRREAVVQTERALGHSYLSTSLGPYHVPFWDMQGAWFTGYVYQAMKDQIIHGYPDNTFKDANPVTRAEAVVIVQQARDYEYSLGIKDTGYNLVVEGHQAPVIEYNGTIYIPADVVSYFPKVFSVWVPEEQQWAIQKDPYGGLQFYEAGVQGGPLKPGDVFMPDDPVIANIKKATGRKDFNATVTFSDSAFYYHGHPYIPARKDPDNKFRFMSATLVFDDQSKTVTIQPSPWSGGYLYDLPSS